MAFGDPGFRSATPGGIMRLLEAYDVPIAGAHAVVIGRSPILGKPVGMLLLASNATVTYTHSRTADLPEIVRTADIVVAAVGKPNFVRGDWLKPGAVVVDAGYNEGNVGDVALRRGGPGRPPDHAGPGRRRADDDRPAAGAGRRRRRGAGGLSQRSHPPSLSRRECGRARSSMPL